MIEQNESDIATNARKNIAKKTGENTGENTETPTLSAALQAKKTELKKQVESIFAGENTDPILHISGKGSLAEGTVSGDTNIGISVSVTDVDTADDSDNQPTFDLADTSDARFKLVGNQIVAIDRATFTTGERITLVITATDKDEGKDEETITFYVAPALGDITSPAAVDDTSGVDNSFADVTGTFTFTPSTDTITTIINVAGAISSGDRNFTHKVVKSHSTLFFNEETGQYKITYNAVVINALLQGFSQSDEYEVTVKSNTAGTSAPKTLTVIAKGVSLIVEDTAGDDTANSLFTATSGSTGTFASSGAGTKTYYATNTKNNSGQLTGTEQEKIDNGFTHWVQGKYSKLYYNDSTGAYEITYEHSAIDALLSGYHSDVYTVKVSSTAGGTPTSQTLTVTAKGMNDKPVPYDDFSDPINEGGKVSGNVLTDSIADRDAETATDDLTVSKVWFVTGIDPNTGVDIIRSVTVGQVLRGEHGTLTLNSNGTYDYVAGTVTASTNTDVFTYEVKDSNGGTATATLTIEVNDVSDAGTGTGRGSTTPTSKELTAVNDVYTVPDTTPRNEADAWTITSPAIEHRIRIYLEYVWVKEQAGLGTPSKFEVEIFSTNDLTLDDNYLAIVKENYSHSGEAGRYNQPNAFFTTRSSTDSNVTKAYHFRDGEGMNLQTSNDVNLREVFVINENSQQRIGSFRPSEGGEPGNGGDMLIYDGTEIYWQLNEGRKILTFFSSNDASAGNILAIFMFYKPNVDGTFATPTAAWFQPINCKTPTVQEVGSANTMVPTDEFSDTFDDNDDETPIGNTLSLDIA